MKVEVKRKNYTYYKKIRGHRVDSIRGNLPGSPLRQGFQRGTPWLIKFGSSFSWFFIYNRVSPSSFPTVETKYPRAQKFWPPKFFLLPK
jgi:hypothetical protein